MNKFSKYLIPSLYIGVVAIMVSCVLLVIFGVKNYLRETPTYQYTIDNVFDSDITPVMKTENNAIVKPFLDDNVQIEKYFYDSNEDSKKQSQSLIYYGNTYIQNKGVDYSNKEQFDIVSVLDGEIINIEDNDFYGKVVTIKHNDNLKTVYSNVKNLLPTVGYKVSQGEVIGVSNNSKTNDNYLLHFEVYYKDKAINPERLYTMQISDLQ